MRLRSDLFDHLGISATTNPVHDGAADDGAVGQTRDRRHVLGPRGPKPTASGSAVSARTRDRNDPRSADSACRAPR